MADRITGAKRGVKTSQYDITDGPDHDGMLEQLGKSDWAAATLPYYLFAGPNSCHIKDFALSIATVIGGGKSRNTHGELLQVHFIPDLDPRDIPTLRQIIDCITVSSDKKFSANEPANADQNPSLYRAFKSALREFKTLGKNKEQELEFARQVRASTVIFDNLVVVDRDIDFSVISVLLEEFDFVVRSQDTSYQIFIATRRDQDSERPINLKTFAAELQNVLNEDRVSPIPAVNPEKLRLLNAHLSELEAPPAADEDPEVLSLEDEAIEPPSVVDTEEGPTPKEEPLPSQLKPLPEIFLENPAKDQVDEQKSLELVPLPKKHSRHNPPVILVNTGSKSAARKEVIGIYGEGIVEFDQGIFVASSETDVELEHLISALRDAVSIYSKRLFETRVFAIEDPHLWKEAILFLRRSRERFGKFEKIGSRSL